MFPNHGCDKKRVSEGSRPVPALQEVLRLRELGRYEIGGRSKSSQAATAGRSINAIQAQLSHRSAQSVPRRARTNPLGASSGAIVTP